MKAGVDHIIQAHVAEYLGALEPARDPLLQKMEERAQKNGHPISDPEVATLLDILVRARGAKRIVEVGTNIGYGAIVLARAAGEDARVDTVEKSAELAEVARGFIAEAGLASRISVHVEDALGFLEGRTQEVDFAYIDCVKEDYPAYLDLLAPRMKAGAMVVADNVLWRGLVASKTVPPTENARVAALRVFNTKLVAHPDFKATVLPFGDGVAVGVKLR